MRKKLFLILIILLFITSCSIFPNNEIAVQTAVAATIQAQPTITVEEPTQEIIPTATPKPTEVPTETAIPEPSATPSPTLIPTQINQGTIAENFLSLQESNGIKIEVVRILIAEKGAIDQDFPSPLFDDKSTLVEFVFRITNNTNQVISFNFYTTIAAVNGEQIPFEDYKWENVTFGSNLDEDILPGSIVIGGYWTGIKRTNWDEVNTIVISIPYAYNSDYSRITEDFLFTINVNNWSFAPIPEELE